MISKIDAAWKENLETAKRTGTVLEYLSTVVPKITQYTIDLSNTWGSVWSTLENIRNLLFREAFGQAYEDIVGWAQQIVDLLVQHGELTETGKRLADALGQAWNEAKTQLYQAIQ